MAHWIDVGATDEIAPQTVREIDYEDTSIAVVNLGGTFHAIENLCTHDYELLSGGTIEGEEIVCPRHGARFCIRTGAVTAPPAYEELATFPVEVRDGRVRVCVDTLTD